MALSKDRVIDRLELLSMSVQAEVVVPNVWVRETANAAIALINSTDVAEVEKLRADNLQYKAAVEAYQGDTEQFARELRESAENNQKLRARVLVLEMEAELHGASRPPALWAVKNTPEHTWLTKSEPFNHCGAWVSESGTSGAMDAFESLPTLSKTPLYFGKPETIS